MSDYVKPKVLIVQCLFGPHDGRDKLIPKDALRGWHHRYEGGRYVLDRTEAFREGQYVNGYREWFLVWRPDDR